MKHRAFDAMTQRYWAMEPNALQRMANIALRQHDKEAWESFKKELSEYNAVQGKIVPRMQGTSQVTVRDRVAILTLSGAIFPKSNLMTDMSGATSLSLFSHDFNTVLEDDGIDAILIDIDSPGGVAFGPGEMAEIISNARGIKPIKAYVSGMCASAAYWIGSAADEIIAHPSSVLGSIGVVLRTEGQVNPDANGYMQVDIVSANAKNKRPDPLSEEGKSVIREELNGLEDAFIGAVAAHRGVSVDDVKTKFGQGGILIASQAVKVGMADRLGSFEDVLTSLSSQNQKTTKGKQLMSKDNKSADAPSQITADTVRQNHPDIAETFRKEGYEAGLAEGRKAGAAAERERIAGIDSLTRAGCEKILSEAKADGVSSKADVALRILEQDKTIGLNYLSSMKDESDKIPAVQPSLDKSGAADDKLPADASIEDRAKAEWDNDPKVKKEFSSFKAYLNTRKAEDVGFGKVR